MIPRAILVALVVLGLLLPTAALVLFGTAHLLTAMDDHAGAMVLQRILLAVAIVWMIDLVALVCAQGINAISGPVDRTDD